MKCTSITVSLPLFLVVATARAQTPIFVDDDAPPGGNGSSWATAYDDLQDALAAATAPATIWVAAGIYNPDDGSDRFATFQLASGVAVYGGFFGDEDPATFDLDDRDFIANETILSRDICGRIILMTGRV